METHVDSRRRGAAQQEFVLLPLLLHYLCLLAPPSFPFPSKDKGGALFWCFGVCCHTARLVEPAEAVQLLGTLLQVNLEKDPEGFRGLQTCSSRCDSRLGASGSSSRLICREFVLMVTADLSYSDDYDDGNLKRFIIKLLIFFTHLAIKKVNPLLVLSKIRNSKRRKEISF